MSTSTKTSVPLTAIQPGYFIVSFVVVLIAIDVESRFGLMPALLVAIAAVVLPTLSYVIRTANPRSVVIDSDASIMTLTYARFGKSWQRSYDIRQFRAVYWSIINDRFPKIDLRLKDRNNKDIRLFWLDYSGRRDREDVPDAMKEVASLLVQVGLEDITRHVYQREEQK